MNSISQWVHQHDLLLLLVALLVAGFAWVVRYRRRSIRLWGLWSTTATLGILGLFLLRTAPVSLSEHITPEASAFVGPDRSAPATRHVRVEPSFDSIQDVQSLLGRGDKHTLVEIYSDYGFS